MGHVRQGRGGFGLGEMKPTWQKATPAEAWLLVVEEVRYLEETARCTIAISQAKQLAGQGGMRLRGGKSHGMRSAAWNLTCQGSPPEPHMRSCPLLQT